MSFEDALREAAERIGVQQEYCDVFQRPHRTAAETNRAILTAIGIDCASEDALRSSIARRDQAELQRPLPSVLVVSENGPIRIPVQGIPGDQEIGLELTTEQGEKQELRVSVHDGFADPGTQLPLGYHELSHNDCVMRLIVTPDRAYVPESRSVGLGVMLYGLRSTRNWGCGDFRDLRALIDWAAEALHAGFIALNPLQAIHNRQPFNNSPYSPFSIFYRNFIYLDVEAVPGYDCIRRRFEDGETSAEIERLRATPFVQYQPVAVLKRRALDLIFEQNPPGRDCIDWIDREGDLLRLYATYCALDEHLHAADPNCWVWTDWPEEYRDPESAAVKKFAEDHTREILFHGWIQWQIDRQLASAHNHALKAGMSIGLYHDLPLATDRGGSDLWAYGDFYVSGCRVGAPPDEFSPMGQDWSFPPPDRPRHRADGYRLYAESIRKTLRHGGALRIDHVMRFFRLYWIPDEKTPNEGAYVFDHAEDLVRILALESVRNRTVIVGEDLGTVEPAIRDALARFGILSYRLLWFEHDNKAFLTPQQYPAQALVASTTHDLATMAGYWSGEDIEARLRAGSIDEESFDRQKENRERDKQHLLDALFRMELLPETYERSAARISHVTGDLQSAICGYMALTPSVLWLVNQEDLTEEHGQQNLPGTTSEFPNWSRKMAWSIEDLSDRAEAHDAAAMVRHWANVSGRCPRS